MLQVHTLLFLRSGAMLTAAVVCAPLFSGTIITRTHQISLVGAKMHTSLSLGLTFDPLSNLVHHHHRDYVRATTTNQEQKLVSKGHRLGRVYWCAPVVYSPPHEIKEIRNIRELYLSLVKEHAQRKHDVVCLVTHTNEGFRLRRCLWLFPFWLLSSMQQSYICPAFCVFGPRTLVFFFFSSSSSHIGVFPVLDACVIQMS